MRLLPLVPTLLIATAWAGPRAQIELLPDAKATAAQVVFGEVAHVRSADLSLVRTLVNLPIGRAPGAGQSAVVSREALARWIRSESGLPADSLAWSGAGSVRVHMESHRISGAQVARVAQEALRSWMASRAAEPEVQVHRAPRDLDVPPGALRLQARSLEHTPLRARMVVWVDVFVGEEFVRTAPVWLSLAPDQSLLPIADGGSSRATDAEVPLPTARASKKPPPIAVARGEWAGLRAGAGSVRLESRAEVLQDGRIGDRIRVRAPGATGVVFANVVAPHRLELAR